MCIYRCKFHYEHSRPSAHCGCAGSFSNSSACQPFKCAPEPEREVANNGPAVTDRLTTLAQSTTFGRGVNQTGPGITSAATSVRTSTGRPLIPITSNETVEVQRSTELPPPESEERNVDLEGSGEVSENAEEEGSATAEEESSIARQSNDRPSHRAIFPRQIAEEHFVKQVDGEGCVCTCLSFVCSCAESAEDELKCRQLPTWVCRPETVNRTGICILCAHAGSDLTSQLSLAVHPHDKYRRLLL